MKTYDLYLHSGPQMKKTYVHVPALLGCTWLRDTTETALDAAPGEIGAYLRFLSRAGEKAAAEAPFRTRIAEHDKSGGFLGSSFLPADAQPVSNREAEALMQRLAALHAEIRLLTHGLDAAQLEMTPPSGRPIARILSHLCAEGAYLRGVSGVSRIQREVDRGTLDPNDALDRLHELELARVRTMSDAERSGVVMRGQSQWSARAALRRMLEHGWEHYQEIARRLGAER